MITTKDKSVNEVVDEVFAALVKQGRRCLNGESCAYGNRDGDHCAVGFLLPDTDIMYFEGRLCHLMSDLSESDIGENYRFLKENSDVMDHVQTLHDSERVLRQSSVARHLKTNFGISSENIDKWIDICADIK